ncbi:MAG: hypothetical protein QOC66_4356 [Pseudonocardiales bacterium]|nr:hypothetical protein [Pseudonocardiales bacterium]
MHARRYADGVNAVDTLYLWTDRVLFWALIALRAWALLDCLTRKAAAFPAVDKLTKPSWVLILTVAGLLGSLASPPLWPISLISAVAAAVYLADVRPAVREIANG